jgi:hypothetical protein
MATRPLPPSPFINSFHSSFRVKHPFQGPTRQWSGTNQLPKRICWKYNKDGFCRINPCKLLHRCAGCRGNHPLLKCSKQGSGTSPIQSQSKSDNKSRLDSSGIKSLIEKFCGYDKWWISLYWPASFMGKKPNWRDL